MTPDELLAAFAIPSEARVDRRVPKKQLAESGAFTASDRRTVTDGVEELVWVAALKPGNIGVPAFTDDVRSYLEIAVLTLTPRADAKLDRLRELIHRAIPYPVVLVTGGGAGAELSLGHIRHALNEAGKTVLDGRLSAACVPAGPWAARLSLARQPATDLHTLYSAWYAALLPLDDLERRDIEIVALCRAAERETQLNRRVDLNLEIQRLRHERVRLLDDIAREPPP